MRRAAALALGGGVLLMTLSGGAEAATPATLPTASEAWYETASCSGAAAGCGLLNPPANPFPANELHVAEAGGQQSTISFLTLDTTALPTGAVVAAGTLHLPLATDTQSGTVNATGADLLACLATGSFGSVEFSTATPPTYDCTGAAHATFDLGASEFRVDLAAVLGRTNGSLANVGIALVPDPAQPPSASPWQLSFNGRARANASTGIVPVQATVSWDPATPAAAPRPPTDLGLPTAPPALGAQLPPPAAPAPSAGLPDVATNPASSPSAAAAPRLAVAGAGPGLTPSSFTQTIRGGQYGLVWAVPLGLVFLGYLAFTTATRR